MGRALIPRYLAALDLTTLDDTQIHTLCDDIALAAKTSTLVLASPPMQTSVAALATKATTFGGANKVVSDDQSKLRADISTEAVARTAVLGELRTYANFATNGATSEADIHNAGLPTLGPRQPRNTPPTVPTQIDTRFPKVGHGKATVAVHETGATRHQYAAQQSLDGITWTQLGVSHGKTRVVTGASGTKVWVRFAMVRGALQSDWSVAAIITLP